MNGKNGESRTNLPKYSIECHHCPRSIPHFRATYDATLSWEPTNEDKMRDVLSTLVYHHLLLTPHRDKEGKEIPPPKDPKAYRAWVHEGEPADVIEVAA